MRPSETASIRVVIADDNDLARAGLSAILATLPGLVVIGEGSNGRQAVALCRALQPDLVLLDVRMPEMDGLAAARAIRVAAPMTRIILVTVHNKLELLLEAIQAGVSAYVLKDASREELLITVRQVLDGEMLLDAEGARRVLQQMVANEPDPAAGSHTLTAREIEVLQLVATGKTNQAVAQLLFVSRGTVKVHIEHILAKLGAASRTEAVMRANQLGILSGRDARPAGEAPPGRDLALETGLSAGSGTAAAPYGSPGR